MSSKNQSIDYTTCQYYGDDFVGVVCCHVEVMGKLLIRNKRIKDPDLFKKKVPHTLPLFQLTMPHGVQRAVTCPQVHETMPNAMDFMTYIESTYVLQNTFHCHFSNSSMLGTFIEGGPSMVEASVVPGKRYCYRKL